MRFTKILFFLSIVALAFQSCKDDCADTDCGANGTCVEGNCNCDEGYTGTNCETLKDLCQSTDCGTNGNCDPATGECNCNEGYDGDTCENEIRQNYVGTFEGDMVPCVPAFIASLIPADELEVLMATELLVTADDPNILIVNIGSTSDILGLSVMADITETDFNIPQFSQDVDLLGQAITISGSGAGKFISESSIQLNLDIVFETALGEFNATCVPIFNKI